MNESDYLRGKRAALTGILRHLLRELGYDSKEAEKTRWIIEREEAIAQLRDLCGEVGDNEWDESLHLADVIEKHLTRHVLAEKRPRR